MNSRRLRARRAASLLVTLLAATFAAACHRNAEAPTSAAVTAALRDRVSNIVVIYAENRAFDNLYGNFPGANGLGAVVDASGTPRAAYVPQKDRDGVTVLATLPRTWRGVTQRGVTPVVTEAESAGLPNAPFAIDGAWGGRVTTRTVTRDLWHRFYENQMQINGGRNDMFAAWADAGGLTMGHFDYSGSRLYQLAREYVLADDFFQGAFGGSFLNHQYLICACAPEYPNADQAAARPSITRLTLDDRGKYTPVLAPGPRMPASALDGPPSFLMSGNLTPRDYFGDGTFRAVNTMQPAYQPSGNAPASTDGSGAWYANPAAATTLPPQTEPTIGDRLTAKHVSWKWYGGSWNAALRDGMQAADVQREVIYAGGAGGIANTVHTGFQAHHQPFNYYAAFDPVQHAAARAEHLKDYDDLVADAAAGTLPAVAFYKPDGLDNQHPGYTDLAAGDARIADLIEKLQRGPQWKGMVVVITYDEFGGAWDHVAPPRGDLLGPGTRIPAIIVSPLARKGTVDHTQYDTGSILRLITRRFGLDPLPGVVARDRALAAAGGRPMGDLTNALNLR
ncbi:MAG TPA: acid phosphatase [Gemmatimonadaceae bacterium]|nr:acid phosphatase [Gemmatimonadaceae bacterium]